MLLTAALKTIPLGPRLPGVRSRGLLDPRSALVWSLTKLLARLRRLLPEIVWDYLFENPDSRPKEDLDAISTELGHRPLRICASQICLMRRPRLHWASFSLVGGEWACTLVPCEHWFNVPLYAEHGEASRWLSFGASCPGVAAGGRLPTAVRAIPHKKPPLRPAGLLDAGLGGDLVGLQRTEEEPKTLVATVCEITQRTGEEPTALE